MQQFRNQEWVTNASRRTTARGHPVSPCSGSKSPELPTIFSRLPFILQSSWWTNAGERRESGSPAVHLRGSVLTLEAATVDTLR
jgi:hypothetical protein